MTATTQTAAETYTVGQCDDNDQWLVIRNGQEVVATRRTKEGALEERDRRNGEEWGML